MYCIHIYNFMLYISIHVHIYICTCVYTCMYACTRMYMCGPDTYVYICTYNTDHRHVVCTYLNVHS